ncbi:hypothetical protein C5167_044327 [Papaver somniferum]|uniref:Uncharacterized protein n=1 Tax=Papaver somniferum TaxID=3469 RepID=A0A4Y7LB47_PAPSO|nr:hypothetical protein C5167_044327 [Papaver somniferum]
MDSSRHWLNASKTRLVAVGDVPDLHIWGKRLHSAGPDDGLKEFGIQLCLGGASSILHFCQVGAPVLERKMCLFLWGKTNGARGMHWVGWDQLYWLNMSMEVYKRKGCMGKGITQKNYELKVGDGKGIYLQRPVVQRSDIGEVIPQQSQVV